MSLKYKRSCLRWPGNKYNLLKNIFKYFPEEYNNYHEPFLGSATVFLNTQPNGLSFISDYNQELVNFYIQLQNNVDELIRHIRLKENSREFYYTERSTKYTNLIEQAAQLYYLNRTCYNGVYRVNSKGDFNVPYGRRESLKVLDEDSLHCMHKKLNNAQIFLSDFSDSLFNIFEDDFVYLDPPYSGRTGNSFSMYNDKLFKWEDQLRLQAYCQELINRNVSFVINNLYNDEVYNLFARDLGINAIITERPLVISSKLSSRCVYQEYLFTNVNF